ncbi:insulinase family protein [Gilvimarinus sp. DA14]|uniref:insulinase family protein n=1 Tax=Gilvimarinus sp. DA14 TaxID=2956798 RepID=UPI0020B842CA|nr:insulinase family protein [Gilvimarinus sp. DA14]UTF61858.1 insulinase family protein [Gilvimarinus sp. DA14]
MVVRQWLWVLFTCALVSVGPVQAQVETASSQDDIAVAVRHSEYDPREYRALRFANGLQVLLIRDTGAPTWVLSINAGSLHDPVQVPDLARLAALSVTSASARRDWEAQTDNLYTHFVFHRSGNAPVADVAAILSGYAPAQADIARAQQNLADEMRAAKAISADDRRSDILNTLLLRKPQSPGVLVTPSASLVQLEHIAEDLQSFTQRYYRPARASLVVRTSAPLDSLESALRQGVGQLPPAPQATEVDIEARVDSEDLPLSVQAELDAEPQLQLHFPVQLESFRGTTKPYKLVSYLLQHRGEGSLVALLRSLGWADSIDTGFSELTENQGVYTVTVRLTELGSKARDQIAALVFYQLDQIRQKGLKAWRFDELAQSAEYEFRYHDWEQARSPLLLARRLHHVDAENVLFAPYQYGAYDEKLNRAFVDALRSDNALLLHPVERLTGGRQTVVTRTRFTASDAGETYPDIKLSVKRKLAFPESNNFVPKRLSMKETSLLGGARTDGVDVLAQKPTLQAWYFRPANTNTPTASVHLRLIFNRPSADAEAAARGLIWSRLYRDALDEALYDAQVAGADYRLLAHPLGLDIQLAGYNTQLGLMLNRMGQVYTDPWPLLERWQQARDALVASLSKGGSEMLHPIYFDQIAQWHYLPSWPRSDLLEALAGQREDAVRRIPQALRLESLFTGDIYRQEAQRLTALAEYYFLPKDAPGAEAAQLLTAEQGALIATVRDTELQVYLQAPGNQERDRVFTSALAQLIDGELVSQVNEAGEQLSPPIAVRAHTAPLAGRPGLRLAASAEVPVEALLQAVSLRLAEPDIGSKLAVIKRRWRHQGQGHSEFELSNSLWQELRKGYRGDERTAVAALNSSSVERYIKQLFAPRPINLDSFGSMEAYRGLYQLKGVGFNLP